MVRGVVPWGGTPWGATADLWGCSYRVFTSAMDHGVHPLQGVVLRTGWSPEGWTMIRPK